MSFGWMKQMCYSYASFKTPEDSLYQAQLYKIDQIFKKISLNSVKDSYKQVLFLGMVY